MNLDKIYYRFSFKLMEDEESLLQKNVYNKKIKTAWVGCWMNFSFVKLDMVILEWKMRKKTSEKNHERKTKRGYGKN